VVSEKTADMARRAKQLYEETLRARLEATHRNDFVAIEPDSGEYFFGKTLSEASQASRAAHPERLACVIRIGHHAAVKIGALTP